MPDDILARLGAFGAATIHEAQGGIGAMDSAIKPLSPTMKVAGRAYTVDCAPADNLAIQYAVTVVKPGDVLVVDAKSFTEAGMWGDVLTEFAQLRGLAGLVIDGAVRDANAILVSGFPVFARGLCIRGTAKHAPGRTNIPIICGGVTICPGDFVIGDADGVVVVAGEDVEEVLRLSAERELKEAAFKASFRTGATLLNLMGLESRADELGYA